MSKQSKFYEQLRQTQANTFSDGLNMDLHPLTTPNTILTDSVNGTMITYNDNEFVLQNDRGNTKIPDAQLSKGFIPVGMKEHNGILYIVSYNPDSKETEIGTYPSPSINGHYKGQIYEGEKQSDLIFLYSDQNQAITYYDYNLAVSNYDKYVLELTSNANPLFVLEHYILDDKGKTHKVELKPSENGVRFTHQGSGILGYKYRPYYINSFETWVTPASGSNFAKLNLKFSSLDQELKSVYINNKNDDLTLRCLIHVELEGFNKNEFINQIVNFDTIHTFDKSSISTFYDLEGSLTKTLDFSKLYDENLKYDYITGVLIDEATGTKYTNFVITSTFYICKDKYRIEMDNLTQTIEVPVSNICVRPQYFDVFRYKKNNDNTLYVEAVLNMEKFDINWVKDKGYSVREASYKLLKLDDNGNIEGKAVFTPNFSPIYSPEGLSQLKSYNVIKSNVSTTPGIGDLKVIDSTYYFIPTITTLSESEDNLQSLSFSSKGEFAECTTVEEIDDVTKVQYVRNFDGTYNILLLNDSYEVLQIIPMDPTSDCDSIKDMVKEVWVDDNSKLLKYEIKNLKYEPNSVYLLQLTFPIQGFDSNVATFFIITTDEMLDEKHYKLDRMDQLHITDWYNVPSQDWTVSYSDPVVITNNTYHIETNTIPIKDIEKCTSEEDVRKLAKNKFWKYQQVLEKSKMWDEIPSVSNTCDAIFTIKGNDTFKYTVDVNLDTKSYMNVGETQVNIPLYKKWSLEGNVIDENAVQTSERQYLYGLFEDDTWTTTSVNVTRAYDTSMYNGGFNIDNLGILVLPFNIVRPFLDKPNSWYYENFQLGVHKLSGACNPFGTYKNESVWRPRTNLHLSKPYGLRGQTLDFMYEHKINSSLCCGKISTANHITYSGNKQKIWMHSKVSEVENYVLLGMNLLQNEITSKLAWENIKRHGYLLKKVNKPVVCYNYSIETDTEGNSEIKIVESNNMNQTVSINYKIYPTLCNAMYFNYDNYNIQSWNNINPNLIDYATQNKTLLETDIDLSLDYSDKIKIYLSELAHLINISNNLLPITENVRSENTVYYDFINSIDSNITPYGKTINTPNGLLYDSENNILYKYTNGGVDSFVYTGGDCVGDLDWNYSEDFCWDVNSTTLQEIDKYNDLWFYKLTNYQVSNESE